MRFIVGFRGVLTPDEQESLFRAGFAVCPDASQVSAAFWREACEPPVEWRSRHVVALEAEDDEDARRQVVEVLRRGLQDPIVAPR